MPESISSNILVTNFMEVAEKNLGDLCNESGKVIYSATTTLCRGDTYLLGINPGGAPGGAGTSTIGENLSAFLFKTTNDYLDEKWPPRTRRLQEHVKKLLTELEYDVRAVCASNVMFTRSRTAPTYKYFKPIADICWPVHAHVLSVVQPRRIIVFGSMPFYYLWERAGKPNKDECLSGNYNRGTPTFCRSFQTEYEGHETVVVGIPHLSDSHATSKTIEFIKDR